MGGSRSARSGGLAQAITWVFEKLGVLNQGSTESAPTPTTQESSETAGISTNALNVTRVGGLAATVTAVGAAALAIFNIKQTSKPAIVVAAYASVGVIVAAALLTAAIIISADIRGRVATQAAAPAGQAKTGSPATIASTAESFTAAWKAVVQRLADILQRLERDDESLVDVWVDASGTTGLTAHLAPPAEKAQDHARLTACQARILAQFESLIDLDTEGGWSGAANGIQRLLDSMTRLLDG